MNQTLSKIFVGSRGCSPSSAQAEALAPQRWRARAGERAVLSNSAVRVVARKLLRGGHEPLRFPAEASNCSFVGKSAASPAGRAWSPCAEAVGLRSVSSAMYCPRPSSADSHCCHDAGCEDWVARLARLEPDHPLERAAVG